MYSPLSLSALVTAIELAGCNLLKKHAPIDSSCRSLWPLGIALVEGASLFSILTSSVQECEGIHHLFDGGEEAGPNLDTRLRCIRDLCSASIYCAAHAFNRKPNHWYRGSPGFCCNSGRAFLCTLIRAMDLSLRWRSPS